VVPQNSKQKLLLSSDQTPPEIKSYTLGQIDDYVAAIPLDSQ
jgi:hypothetical protein